MNYQIGSTTITAEELADMKRTDIDCAFWIKRIQNARMTAINLSLCRMGEISILDSAIFNQAIPNELAAIGVKIV